MSSNLFDTYNPLYDANLRHYFTSPHMQRHLRSIGLLDSNGVPVPTNGNVESEVYSRHYVMMDMLLRNREQQLNQFADLQRKLDAAEKVQSYRRVRSGATSPDTGRRFHASRSLSRPRGGRIERRRHSNHYEDGDVIKRVEQEYDNEIPPIRNIYDRLAQKVTKYRYLHKLDDKTLTSYTDSIKNQLDKLERFRGVSFGPASMARQQAPPQNSWFFRRRSLPSLTSSAPANSLHQPLRSINSLRSRARNGASQSPRKLNEGHNSRSTFPARSERSKLPPLPRKPVGLPPKPNKQKQVALKREASKDKLPTLAVVGVPIAAAAGTAVLGATELLKSDKDDDSGSMIDYGPDAEDKAQNGFYEAESEQQTNGHHEEPEIETNREQEEREPTPVAFEVSVEELKAEPYQNGHRKPESDANGHNEVFEEKLAEEPEKESVPFEVSAEEIKDHSDHPDYHEEPEASTEALKIDLKDHFNEPVFYEVSAQNQPAQENGLHSFSPTDEKDFIKEDDPTPEPRDRLSAAGTPEPDEHGESFETVIHRSFDNREESHAPVGTSVKLHEHQEPQKKPAAFGVSAEELKDHYEDQEDFEAYVPEPAAFEVSAEALNHENHEGQEIHLKNERKEVVPKAEDHQELKEVSEAHVAESVAFEVSAEDLKDHHEAHEAFTDDLKDRLEPQEAHEPRPETPVPESVAFEVPADDLKHNKSEHRNSPDQSDTDYIKNEEEVHSYEVPHVTDQHDLREEPLLETHHGDKRLLSPGEDHPTINLIEPSDCGDSSYQEDVRSVPITPTTENGASFHYTDMDPEPEHDITSLDNNSDFSEPSGHDRNISETPLKQPKNTPDNLSDDDTERMSTTISDDGDDTSVTMSSRADSIAA